MEKSPKQTIETTENSIENPWEELGNTDKAIGEANTQGGQNEPSFETIETTPNYLLDIDSKRREEIITTSAEITQDIPGAIIIGGNANRILYEAYTGKTMFGVGKNDTDIYIPSDVFDNLLNKQPEGYKLKRELDENSQEKWIRPDEGYIVLVNSAGEHIDVFEDDGSCEFVEVELDGQIIRVKSLVDQIKSNIKLFYDTEGMTKMDIDPIHNPDPVSKYGVYTQRILEMVGSEKGQVEIAQHADKLPENWRETLEVIASLGEYGIPTDVEKVDAIQEELENWKNIQECVRQIQEQLINDLRAYFDANYDKSSDKSSGSLPGLVNGFESVIFETLNEASDSNDFIHKILERLSASEKNVIKDRIRKAAESN